MQQDFGIVEIDDVSELYKDQDRDINNYNRFIEYILKLTSEYEHLAILVPGHPLLGVTFIDLLKDRAMFDLQIEIVDGISSFDLMTTFFEIDPLEQGTVLLDANRLLLFQYQLEPSLIYFIYHICSVGNPRTNYLKPSIGNRLDFLRDYLLKFYSEDKEIYLCRVSNSVAESSSKFSCLISDLESQVEKIDFSTTLFIPAEKPSKIDWEYLNYVYSVQ